jgi:GNAT superfamily N-acetyltransferase
MTGTEGIAEVITVRRLAPDDWRTWRAVRLEALADAPHAYGSSLAREEALGEADWRRYLEPTNGVMVVARLGERVVGAIGGYTAPGADAVMLIAMWVRPGLRGRGVGDALVGEILAWARETGWSRVELRVADGNPAARRLFERHGFAPTGRSEPLESDPTTRAEFLARSV